MPYTSALKRFLNIFIPNPNLDRICTNICASTTCFQDLLDGEQEKDNLAAAYSREVQASQVLSATKVRDEHYSYLKSHDIMELSLSKSPSFDHADTSDGIVSELDDDDSEATEESEPSFAVANPIVFSEDPIICSNEMLEFANDLVDIAVTNITENEEIMESSEVEDLSWWKERLDERGEMLEILETDTPATRLLKARTYLMAAGEFLKRVIFVVELAKSLNENAVAARRNSTQLEDSDSIEWRANS